jgi:hypothetical protein
MTFSTAGCKVTAAMHQWAQRRTMAAQNATVPSSSASFSCSRGTHPCQRCTGFAHICTDGGFTQVVGRPDANLLPLSNSLLGAPCYYLCAAAYSPKIQIDLFLQPWPNAFPGMADIAKLLLTSFCLLSPLRLQTALMTFPFPG